MRRILYISTARPGLPPSEIIKVLRLARARNRMNGITGLLLFDRVRFMQVLEGPEDKIEATFNRIRDDSRHYGLVKLEDRIVEERQFEDLSMAGYGIDASDIAQTVDEIDSILSDLDDIVLRDQIMGFSRIRGAAEHRATL